MEGMGDVSWGEGDELVACDEQDGRHVRAICWSGRRERHRNSGLLVGILYDSRLFRTEKEINSSRVCDLGVLTMATPVPAVLEGSAIGCVRILIWPSLPIGL